MGKYKKGEKITSLDEFARQKLIYDARANKIYDRGWSQSWQFRYIYLGINHGWFYKVEQRENIENERES